MLFRSLAVGAFEDVLRLVNQTLQLLPADRTRERAEALTTLGGAMRGLGRLDEAKAAWHGAIESYKELGDSKSSDALHRRIAHLDVHSNGREPNGAAPTDVAPEAPVEVTS